MNEDVVRACQPRVELGRAVRGDALELIAANRANRDYHHPWCAPFTDQEGFDLWLIRCTSGPHVGLVAREVENGRIVGVVNINEIVFGVFQSAYLAYYGMSEFKRKGLMTEALRLAVKLAFEELRLHRLEANVQPDNHASIALVRKLGFEKEGFSPRYSHIDGEWRDHERWALLT
jgi:[ribosomal protein S5]-alanine N-acetyltransferase